MNCPSIRRINVSADCHPPQCLASSSSFSSSLSEQVWRRQQRNVNVSKAGWGWKNINIKWRVAKAVMKELLGTKFCHVNRKKRVSPWRWWLRSCGEKEKGVRRRGRQWLISADTSAHAWGRWVGGLVVGGVALRNTAGAKKVRAGLYLTSPACGLHLERCVRYIPSLTKRVSAPGGTRQQLQTC